ncbi:hypothetical protein BpHYR1_042934 [Brachionus plicatilis]|uniref:Uncharacterized protein n=1 Tax=Brachionus plicatilis TaxID=10195 RepID=A0A3M7SVR0_BRAPC|nr:hypothetical protein BpHYR1_042934 [Brachionus plicatilis]
MSRALMLIFEHSARMYNERLASNQFSSRNTNESNVQLEQLNSRPQKLVQHTETSLRIGEITSYCGVSCRFGVVHMCANYVANFDHELDVQKGIRIGRIGSF